MEPDWLSGHYRPRIMRRASDHGTAATEPESNSRARLAISSAQAASAPSSMSSSRLSSNEAARAARASGESLSASSRSRPGSSAMFESLLLRYTVVRQALDANVQ